MILLQKYVFVENGRYLSYNLIVSFEQIKIRSEYFMFNPKNLLLYEYFPSELPPCFNTIKFAEEHVNVLNALTVVGRNYSIPLKYSGYKSESSRRKFAIPNPYHYCQTVKLLVDNKDELSTIFNSSTYSLTAPKKGAPKNGQAYAKRSSCVADSKREIEKCFQNNKYEIRLDINSFFDNIYTHSIPWAIHGISYAKTHRNDKSLLGNKIDFAMRSLNYEQTNGVLVGNSVSRIVSEIILCTIDKQIKNQFPDVECCRFVDDYYIYTTNNSQIQQIIAFIRNALAQFELSFNENKIQINESPFLYGKPWVEKIKQYLHYPADIFISKLIAEYKIYMDISIFKYGLKVLYHAKFNSFDWPAIQSRLINLWVSFPSLSDLIIKILIKNKDRLKMTSLKKAIYSVIDESIMLNREQELIWAIWFVKVFNIKISQKYILRIFNTTNELAIIILLSIIDKSGRRDEPAIKSQLIRIHEKLKEDDVDDKGNTNALMWSSHWLLAYEANRNRWLNYPDNPFEYARKNAFFKVLLEHNVKFYDEDFNYSLSDDSGMDFEFATRSELYRTINGLKGEIIEKQRNMLKSVQSENTSNNSEKVNDICDKIIEIIEQGNDFYL